MILDDLFGNIFPGLCFLAIVRKTAIVYKLEGDHDDVVIFEKGYKLSDSISSTHDTVTAAPVVTGKTSGVVAIPSTKNSQIVIFIKG